MASDVGAKGSRGVRRDFEDFDLRVSHPAEPAAKAALRAAYRAKGLSPARDAGLVDLPARLAAARASLAARIPALQVTMNLAGRVPEVVGVSGGEEFLTAPSAVATRESVARGFLSREAAVYGLTATEMADLVKFADYVNPSGSMAWVEFRQDLLGLPVFQGEIRCGFTASGALARTTGNLVPGLDSSGLSAQPTLSPAEAVAKAAATIRVEADPARLTVRWTEENGRLSVLSGGPFEGDTRAELVWFPVEPGVAVLAWATVLWRPLASYYLLVDAHDGTLLWRKKVTSHQTQPVTYAVYPSDSPAPLSPGSTNPGVGTQGTAVPRALVSLVADDLNASPLGWITDGGNATVGNNVSAGLDLSAPDGVDANVTGSAFRVFDFVYNPPPGVAGAPGSSDLTDAEYRKGAVTHLFFWANRYHDRLWQLGFTEPARNFQSDNFGRGGSGGDAISAQAQDYATTNNADASWGPDGYGGRVRFFVFTRPSPRRDSGLDTEIVLHELTHCTSGRLHGNGSGLGTQPARGMGEGWSDFYARCLLATADEPLDGTYAFGAYAALGTAGGLSNYYYGLRRFPYAVKSAVGSNGKPHNPLTLADIDTTKVNLSDGAYGPGTPASLSAGEEHNVGEVWCMMLLEFRARLIQRLGFAVGNERALQIVTDAMKLDPLNPTFIDGRDAIAAAANAGPGGAADAADALAAFALRGAGTGATSSNPPDGDYSIRVTESFSVEVSAGAITYSDAAGNNNGVPEPGETLAIMVPLTNSGASTVSPVSVTLNGVTSTVSLAPATTQFVTFSYPIAPATACGTTITLPVTLAFGGNTAALSFSFQVGALVVRSLIENFESVSPPALPAGWTTAAVPYSGGTPGALWATRSTTTLDGRNSVFVPNLANVGGGSSILTSPAIAIPAEGAVLSFQHRWGFEVTSGRTYDGGVLEIAISGVAGGAFQDILSAGGSFQQGGYNGTIATASTNPISDRQAFTGSAGRTTTLAALPTSARGRSVQFRWRLGFDDALGADGWEIDSIALRTLACAPANDADGDGLPDAWELAYGLNPASPADAAQDADGDGVSNFDEFRAGTDPRDPASVLRASVSRDAIGQTTVTFPSQSDRSYAVEYRDDLASGTWVQLRGAFAGSGDPMSVLDTAPPSATGRRFYRVRVVGR